jgi:FKBP-type peptidyl-prolyl cis-trans isomerase (trigger factor)
MAKSSTKTSNKSSIKQVAFETKLSWLPKKTFELEITIPKDKIEETYQKVLKKAADNTEIKGFRKGKAPIDLVEKQLEKASLYEEVANQLIPETYDSAIDQHKLHPIITPKIELVKAKLGEDWVVKAVSCEPPDVKIGDYKDKIKTLKAKDAIWTPDKAKKPDADKPKKVELNQIFEELLKVSQIEIADLLAERETNRMLTQLLDQVNALGMTIQQYAQSKGKTEQQLRQEYQRSAIDGLKLEFILNTISVENNITVTEQEIDDFITKIADPKLKDKPQNPTQKTYLGVILRKQKTLDFLQSL